MLGNDYPLFKNKNLNFFDFGASEVCLKTIQHCSEGSGNPDQELIWVELSVSRQLQQQQQAELDRGGSGDGLYEAGPIALSQVSLLPQSQL